MKSIRNGRTGWIALFIAMVASLSIVEPGRASPPRFERFRVSTKDFALNFEVGEDGRLYQRAVGGVDENATLLRSDESYPPAGDGYVWEPALQVVHADGNTSTA